MAQGAREHGAVDAARRRAGNDVDNDPQLDLVSDLAQEFEVDFLGVVFGIGAIGRVEKTRLRALSAVADAMQRARGTHQLENFLADPVHVDGKGNAAKANQRNAQLFLDQAGVPGDP